MNKNLAVDNQLTDEAIVADFLVDVAQLNLFEELIRRYEQKLIRYGRSLGLELNSAEDVVQDCFIKAYKNIRGFNGQKGKFSSWIYRIMHNVAVDHFKKSKKDLLVDDETWWDGVADSKNFVEELEIKIEGEQLVRAIGKLNLKYKEPLLLYFLEGKSYKEVAEILRLPVATVSTRIRRGKEALKLKLKEDSKASKID
jgi:RNA polymerase sigma-70 factor (ECF subfamily)